MGTQAGSGFWMALAGESQRDRADFGKDGSLDKCVFSCSSSRLC